MFENIKSDLSAYTKIESPGPIDFLNALAKSVGFQAVFMYRVSRFFRMHKVKFLSFLLDRLSFHLYAAEIKSSADIGPGFTVAHPAGLVVGAKVVAGSNFSVRQNVTLGGNNGKLRGREWSQPLIGDNVIIGCGSAVLGPIKISSNSIVGACSLVISDIDFGEVWGGVPAKRIKFNEEER